MIAEELSQEPRVWCLATSGARTRELEERLCEGHILDGDDIQLGPVGLWQGREELPIRPFTVLAARAHRGNHHECAVRAIVTVHRWANFKAECASCAVLGRYLQAEDLVRKLPPLSRYRHERRWSLGQICQVHDLFPDSRVRADHRALPALDAEVGIPDRQFTCKISFFELRGPSQESPVGGHCADREILASASNQHRCQPVGAGRQVAKSGRDIQWTSTSHVRERIGD